MRLVNMTNALRSTHGKVRGWLQNFFGGGLFFLAMSSYTLPHTPQRYTPLRTDGCIAQLVEQLTLNQ